MPRFAVFLAALAFSAAAFAQDVTFGASVQLTGPVANTGRYYKDAYEFAIDKINAAGGVKVGSQQHKIALKLLDNQSDVNLSVRQYTQLLTQEKVNFLLGPFASNFVLADSSIAEKASVPMVQGGGASDEIYARGYKYIFGTLPAASDYFGSTIEALAVANDTAFGLCAGICTTSLKHAAHFKRNAEAGMVMVNLPTAGVDYHVPFGGRKGSSYGPREQGRYAAEFYTTVKTSYTLP